MVSGSLIPIHAIRFSIASFVALVGLAVGPVVMAEAPQDACDRLAADTVPIEKLDAASAVPDCAAAVKAAPGTPRLEYEYGRALEKAGSIDPAKEMYQWASDDGFAPATTALARINALPPSATMSESDRRRQVASHLDALADFAQRTADAAPRDHDDPNAILAITGTDPVAILKWVQSNTHLIPYAGSLRGSSGVLMDRAGNSLDRSLLLADLLGRAGHEVRIARAQLDPATASALRAKAESSIPKPAPPAPFDRASFLKRIESDPRLDKAVVEKALDQTTAADQRFSASAEDLYGKVYPAVLQALGTDPKRDQQLAADAESDLRDHFWVQREVSNGWEDLDPDSDVVNKPSASATFAPDHVPEDLKQRVTLRVIVETWSAGKLSESNVLERSWTPSELTGKTILLTHSLFPATPIDQIAQQPDAQGKYIEGLAKAWVIEPILRVGNDTVTDKLYDLRGETLPAGKATLASLGVGGLVLNTQPLNQVLGAFGDNAAAAKSKPPDEATAPIKVTAEWIEFQIDVPGRASERRRRAVFDLIGPAARSHGPQQPPVIDQKARTSRALALAGATDILIFGATPNPSSIQRLAGEQLASFIKQVAERERSTNDSVSDIVRHPTSGRFQPTLWGWAMNRFVASIPAADPVAPNIALFWQSASVDSGGAVKPTATFDIVASEVEAGAGFRNRVAQGVADTVVERAMLGDAALGINPAYLYAQDLSVGRHWTMLTPGDHDRVEHLGFAPDARARVIDDLARGSIVIARDLGGASTPGERAAWWRIDPHSGVALGMGEDGRGPEMAEEALDELLVNLGICGYMLLGPAVVKAIAGAPLASYSNYATLALCLGLGAAGYASAGTWLAPGVELYDWVLRVFEAYETAEAANNPHGE